MWTPRIAEDGSVIINSPRCKEEGATLKYKGPKPFKLPALAPEVPAPTGLASGPDSILGTVLSNLPPSSPVPFSPGLPDQQEAAEGIRELQDGDRTQNEYGPYCTTCKALRRLPKSVGECRLEVLLAVKRELGLV